MSKAIQITNNNFSKLAEEFDVPWNEFVDFIGMYIISSKGKKVVEKIIGGVTLNSMYEQGESLDRNWFEVTAK